MYGAKDLEELYFLYKTKDESKGVSINSFCVFNNFFTPFFYDWYKKTQKKTVPVEIDWYPNFCCKECPCKTSIKDESKSLPIQEVVSWLQSKRVKFCAFKREAYEN